MGEISLHTKKKNRKKKIAPGMRCKTRQVQMYAKFIYSDSTVY